MSCRSCPSPLFAWEQLLGTCRSCFVAAAQDAQIVRRADGGLCVLPPQVLDRLQALMVGQLPPLKMRMAQRFEVKRHDGTRETVYDLKPGDKITLSGEGLRTMLDPRTTREFVVGPTII